MLVAIYELGESCKSYVRASTIYYSSREPGPASLVDHNAKPFAKPFFQPPFERNRVAAPIYNRSAIYHAFFTRARHLINCWWFDTPGDYCFAGFAFAVARLGSQRVQIPASADPSENFACITS